MTRFSLRAFFRWFALGVVIAVYVFPFVRNFHLAPDAGVFLYGADLVSHGAVPSRDFVEPQGPGSFVWLAIFFKVFGSTLATARAVLVATGVGLGLLAFGLSRRLGAKGIFATMFVVMMSIPLLPINSPHYDSNLFALGALVVFLAAWDKLLRGETPAVWPLVSSAVLCGVTGWMIQQKGLYEAVALLASLAWLRRWRAAVVFGCAYAAAVAMPFVYFAAMRALPDALFANYIWPLTTYSDINAAPYGFPIWANAQMTWSQMAHAPIQWMTELVSVTPFVLVAGLPLLLPVVALMSGRRWFEKPMLPYWLAAYALWVAELHRLDMGHLRNGVVLMAVLFFGMCETGGKRVTRIAALVVTLCLAQAGATNFLMNWEGAPRQTRRGPLCVKEEAAVLDFLEAHTRPGDSVFVYPYQPVFYFLEDLKNPTRYSYLLYQFHSDAQFAEAARDLERKKVRYVVVDSLFSGERIASVFPAYRQPAREKLIMEPYLEAHYGVAAEAGRFRVLERRDGEMALGSRCRFDW